MEARELTTGHPQPAALRRWGRARLMRRESSMLLGSGHVRAPDRHAARTSDRHAVRRDPFGRSDERRQCGDSVGQPNQLARCAMPTSRRRAIGDHVHEQDPDPCFGMTPNDREQVELRRPQASKPRRSFRSGSGSDRVMCEGLGSTAGPARHHDAFRPRQPSSRPKWQLRFDLRPVGFRQLRRPRSRTQVGCSNHD